MATRIRMSNPASGLIKDGFHGFSWTTLLFGGFPALFRADFLTFIGYFAIAFILVMVTGGIGSFLLWIIWPFMYNKYYTRRLLERGFRFAGSNAENQRAAEAVGASL